MKSRDRERMRAKTHKQIHRDNDDDDDDEKKVEDQDLTCTFYCLPTTISIYNDCFNMCMVTEKIIMINKHIRTQTLILMGYA